MYSGMASWKEFCTVRMSCSRRSGHTTAIARVVPEYFNSALILTPKRVMIDSLHREFSKIYSELQTVYMENGVDVLSPIREETDMKVITGDSEYMFASIGSIQHFAQHRFEAVVVDVASLFR